MSRPTSSAESSDAVPRLGIETHELELELAEFGDALEAAERRRRVAHQQRRHALEHGAGDLPSLNRAAIDAELERETGDGETGADAHAPNVSGSDEHRGDVPRHRPRASSAASAV